MPSPDPNIDEICHEFRQNWSPATTSISSVLEHLPAAQTHDVLVALLDLDLEIRRTRGIPVDATAYADQAWYPQYSELVRTKLDEAAASDNDYETLDPNAFGIALPIARPVTTIGNYALERRLGVGGMGEVHLAHHVRFKDRKYAVKIIRQDCVSHDGIERFEREIDAMGHLSHRNLIFAADAGRWQDRLYLVMEYVEGIDLQELLDHGGPLPISEACELIRQAAFGIAHAHKVGIVHRDIKPSNMMLSSNAELKVLDLGLASLQRTADNLTAAGTMMGTGAFMSSEQWQDSRSAGKPSDVYALGCTIYSLLSGKPPFSWDADSSLPALMRGHLSSEPVDLSERRKDVPPQLCKLVSQCLRKDPEDRLLVGELVTGLGDFCDDTTLSRSVSVVRQHLNQKGAIEQQSSVASYGLLAGSSVQPSGKTLVQDRNEKLHSEQYDSESNASGLGWSRNTYQEPTMLLWVILGSLLLIGTISLVLAYFGPGQTEAWIQRFDRLNKREVPPGTGFAIELARLFCFVGLTCFIVGSRFSGSIRNFFDLRRWNLKLAVLRMSTFALVCFFVINESRRHLSLEMAPAGMVTWGAEHEIVTTASAEAWPYFWYLPYSLVSYIIVLGGLFAFPFIRFWLSDYSYIQGQVARFREIQSNVKSSDMALRNLQRFALECHQLTKRYIDLLGVLCFGIQYEYWIGQLTLTGAGLQTAMMGWFAVAFAFAFVMSISACYVNGYNATEEVVASRGSLDDTRRLGTISVVWFMKKAVVTQFGGILLLSLILVGIHAMVK